MQKTERPILTGYAQAPSGQVFVENDLRAFANPTRMLCIENAAEDLLHRLQTPCPHCSLPGFGIVERIRGLACAVCGTATTEIKAILWQCPSCGHQHVEARSEPSTASPGNCPLCNP